MADSVHLDNDQEAAVLRLGYVSSASCIPLRYLTFLDFSFWWHPFYVWNRCTTYPNWLHYSSICIHGTSSVNYQLSLLPRISKKIEDILVIRHSNRHELLNVNVFINFAAFSIN